MTISRVDALAQVEVALAVVGECSVHQDGLQPGSKVLIVDDVLATAGTVRATASLV